MQMVHTSHAPKPAGHYTQAVVHQGVVYVAGQLPIDPTSGHKFLGSIEQQTRQALKNVAAILEASGSDLQHVLRMTLYIADITLWDRVNGVYAEMLGDHRPARVVVPTKVLHHGFQIEIDAIAAVRETA